MVQPHLVNYVREQMKAGYSADEIRTFLVGQGYPIREIDEAVEHAKRPLHIVQAEAQIKKAEGIAAKAKLEKAREEEENFIDLFKIWFMALFMPGHVFPEEKHRATIGRALMNVLISASLGGLITAIIMAIKLIVASPVTPLQGGNFFKLAPLTTIQQITLVPLGAFFAWLALTAYFYLFGLLLGGSGTFERFAHFTSLISAPLILLLSVLTMLLPKCINFFTLVVFGILGIYPMLYAIKETHETEFGKAALATFVPILLIAVLMMPAFLRFKSLFSQICAL